LVQRMILSAVMYSSTKEHSPVRVAISAFSINHGQMTFGSSCVIRLVFMPLRKVLGTAKTVIDHFGSNTHARLPICRNENSGPFCGT
jgi:hypothetical protein